MRKALIISTLWLALWSQTLAAAPHFIEIMPWPMFQGNAAHTGFVDTTLNPQNFKFAWKTYVGDESDVNYAISQVMVDGALVYVSRSNYVYSNTFQAFSTLSGRQVWKKSFGEVEVTPPTVVNNDVYMDALNYGSDEGSGFYHFNVITGEDKNILPTGSIWHNFISASYYNDNLYFADQHWLYSYNVTNKKISWLGDLYTNYVLWAPAVNEKYVATYADGEMEIFDRSTGKQITSIKDPNYFFGGGTETIDLAPVFMGDNNILGIQGHKGYLTIYDITNKNIDSILGPGFSGMPAVDSNFIYAAQNGQLVVLDRSGKYSEKWSWSPPNNESVQGQMLTTDNLVFVSTESNVYAIDKQTHQAVWNYPADGQLSLGMGYLFIMQHSGDLFAIRVV